MSEKKVCVFQELGTCNFAIRSTKNPEVLEKKLNRYCPRGVLLVGCIEEVGEDSHYTDIYDKYEDCNIHSFWFELSLNQVFDILGIDVGISKKKDFIEDDHDTYSLMLELIVPKMKGKGLLKASEVYHMYRLACKSMDVPADLVYPQRRFYRSICASDRFMKVRRNDGAYYSVDF